MKSGPKLLSNRPRLLHYVKYGDGLSFNIGKTGKWYLYIQARIRITGSVPKSNRLAIETCLTYPPSVMKSVHNILSSMLHLDVKIAHLSVGKVNKKLIRRWDSQTWLFSLLNYSLAVYTGWRKKRGHPISLQIFWKLHDRIAWKLMNFCNIIAEHSH